MRVIEAIERQPIAIPITEILSADGGIDLIPEVRARGYFDVDFRRDELVLVAGRFIGQIPLTSEIAIHVRPKVPIQNLSRLIGIASPPVRCLDFFRRKYRLEGIASSTIMEAMARSLVASLRDMIGEGVYREYFEERALIPSVRGRIDLRAYVRDLASRPAATELPCRYPVLSTDTVFNRVIKRAIMQLGYTLADLPGSDAGVRRELEEVAAYFDRVPLDLSEGLLDGCTDMLSSRSLPDLRAYYLDILDTCLLILQRQDIRLETAESGLSMHSVVIDLEDTFEKYVRTILQSWRGFPSSGVSVLDGNAEGKGTLFSDTSLYDAKPDIVLMRGSQPLCLLDVKYKAKLAEVDRYQLISHSVAFGVARAGFVVPKSDDAQLGAAHVGMIGNSDLSIELFCMDLNSADLHIEEHRLCQWVEHQLATQPIVAH